MKKLLLIAIVSTLTGCTYDEVNSVYRAAGAAIGTYRPTPQPVVVVDEQ